ncbi:MAG: EamA family transporter [Candidatus Bathyarchaeia archaeon]|nr:EamA family transporter [Candidatus Bathyarchaeota archaeon]
MFPNWLFWSLIGLILWGFWGYTSKLAAEHAGWSRSIIFFGLGVMLSTLILTIILTKKFSTALTVLNKGSFYALASGITCLLGAAAVYIALEEGKAALVIPFTALYPLITIILSIILLKEKIGLMQGFGVILAIIAMFLLSK